jgi:hypothetical protein
VKWAACAGCLPAGRASRPARSSSRDSTRQHYYRKRNMSVHSHVPLLLRRPASTHDARTMPAPQLSLWPLVQTRPLASQPASQRQPAPASASRTLRATNSIRRDLRHIARPSSFGFGRWGYALARPHAMCRSATCLCPHGRKWVSFVIMASLSIERSERGRELALRPARGSHALLAARCSRFARSDAS